MSCRGLSVISCIALNLFVSIQARAAGSAARPVTMADIVQMSRFADDVSGSQVAHYSPDGSQLVVVIRKGILNQNTNQYSLVLLKTPSLGRHPHPRVLITMSSSSNRPAIEDLKWLEDGESIVFLGEQRGSLHQLFRFDLKKRLLTRLTRHPTNIIAYSTTPNGATIAYTAEEPQKGVFTDASSLTGLLVSTQSLSSLVSGREDTGRFAGNDQLFLQTQSRSPRPIEISGKIPVWRETPFLSPDAKWIVIANRVSRIPPMWSAYSEPRLHQEISRHLSRGEYSSVQEYLLIDTASGISRVLLNSPLFMGHGIRNEVVWSADSRSVVVGGVYLPIDAKDTDGTSNASTPAAVEIMVPSLTWATVSQGDVSLRYWDSRANVLAFGSQVVSGEINKEEEEVQFAKVNGSWRKINPPFRHRSKPLVRIEQDMNTPPRLVAIDARSHQASLLLDLNLQFTNLKLSRVEEIQWRGTDGRQSRGGLYYPVNYVKGHRYPLVIQTHGWRSDKFWPDGPWTTAYAAQPLAAKDIMVLQVGQFLDKDWWEKNLNTPAEVDGIVASYDGAIDHLDQAGLIDPARIGIVGFSRTCLYVKFALTHSDHHFAAATVTDGIDAGYFQYISYSNTYPQESEYINGGLPFGTGLTVWRERSPGFNVDKVHTPLRIVALNTRSVLGEWEWYSALRRLGKPSEMIVIEDGEHILERPRDRMISQQGTVEWFAFWLNGEENQASDKREQYQRWKEMRERTAD